MTTVVQYDGMAILESFITNVVKSKLVKTAAQRVFLVLYLAECIIHLEVLFTLIGLIKSVEGDLAGSVKMLHLHTRRRCPCATKNARARRGINSR